MYKAILLGAFASISIAYAHTASAQTYPSKPVRMIVPWAAGGTSDVTARIVAQKLTASWATQVFVENRAGAGGTRHSIRRKNAPGRLLASDGLVHGTGREPARIQERCLQHAHRFRPHRVCGGTATRARSDTAAAGKLGSGARRSRQSSAGLA